MLVCDCLLTCLCSQVGAYQTWVQMDGRCLTERWDSLKVYHVGGIFSGRCRKGKAVTQTVVLIRSTLTVTIYLPISEFLCAYMCGFLPAHITVGFCRGLARSSMWFLYSPPSPSPLRPLRSPCLTTIKLNFIWEVRITMSPETCAARAEEGKATFFRGGFSGIVQKRKDL